MRRDGGNGEHALRRVGLGRAGELLGTHFGDVDAALAKIGKECGAPRRIGELRRDECAVDAERGASELLDGAHSLGGEEPLALARLSALEIAS